MASAGLGDLQISGMSLKTSGSRKIPHLKNLMAVFVILYRAGLWMNASGIESGWCHSTTKQEQDVNSTLLNRVTCDSLKGVCSVHVGTDTPIWMVCIKEHVWTIWIKFHEMHRSTFKKNSLLGVGVGGVGWGLFCHLNQTCEISWKAQIHF